MPKALVIGYSLVLGVLVLEIPAAPLWNAYDLIKRSD
jgi:hypothetical protein